MVSSVGPLFQTTQEPIKIQTLRSNIKNFKSNDCQFNINIGRSIQIHTYDTSWNLLANVNNNQNIFLIYCCNEPILERLANLLRNDSLLLSKCKAANINDYSGLGAIFTREDLNKNETIAFITTLKTLGFKPTDNDKQIINLKIYDTISTNHKTTTNLLLTHNNYTPLPFEVKKIIMTDTINLYTKNYY